MPLVLLCLATTTPAAALETDPFFAWRTRLDDLGPDLNTWIAGRIRVELDNLDADVAAAECDEVAVAVMERFRGLPLHPVENWLRREHANQLAPPGHLSNPEVFRRSVFRAHRNPLRQYYYLGRALNVGGVYFGSDKLGHFFSTALRYLAVFQRERRLGRPENQALEAAIDLGIALERSVLGLRVSGVFSYADLEANYQGLRFLRSLCEGDRPLIGRDASGNWTLQRPPELRSYVNPAWDEGWYTSSFSPQLWEQIAPQALQAWCGGQGRALVRQRIARYRRQLQPGFSIAYLDRLKRAGDSRLPAPTLRWAEPPALTHRGAPTRCAR